MIFLVEILVKVLKIVMRAGVLEEAEMKYLYNMVYAYFWQELLLM